MVEYLPKDCEASINGSILDEVMSDLIDEVTLGLCFDIHRACKRGYVFLDETDEESQKQYEIVDIRGLDVFGQAPNTVRKNLDCVCPNCQRSLAASRFAPHLEKCMGMGRTSSRVASRRIAKTGKDEEGSEPEEQDPTPSREERDKDWNYCSDKRAKKIRREKHMSSPRHRGGGKPRKPGYVYVPQTDSYEGKSAFLSQSCGVISKETGKICTRSHRCPHHTDEQRRSIRNTLGHGRDDDVIDVDSFEESGLQNMLWEVASNDSLQNADSSARVPLRTTIKLKTVHKLSSSVTSHKPHKSKKTKHDYSTTQYRMTPTNSSSGSSSTGRVTPPPFGHEYSKGE